MRGNSSPRIEKRVSSDALTRVFRGGHCVRCSRLLRVPSWKTLVRWGFGAGAEQNFETPAEFFDAAGRST